MTKIIDPGLNKTREEARTARLEAWKRPATEKKRAAARSERIADWSEKYGDIDSARRRTT